MASALGLFGVIPFVCSDSAMMTFKDLSVSRSTRWATHEVIGRKPVLEYVGENLATVTFNMQFMTGERMPPPLIALKGLKELFDQHKAHRLLIGPDYLGKFVIESIGEERKHHNRFGVCVNAEVSLTLKEAE